MDNNIRFKRKGQFATRGGKFRLSFKWEFIGDDLLLVITGGQAHVGAVSLIGPEGRRGEGRVLERPHHKESVITRQAAEILGPHLKGALCCIAGIHYDNLSREETRQVVLLSERGLRWLRSSAELAP